MPTAIEEKDAIREVLAEYCFALDGGRYDDMAALPPPPPPPPSRGRHLGHRVRHARRPGRAKSAAIAPDDMAALFTADGTWDTAFGAATGRAAHRRAGARRSEQRAGDKPPARGAPRRPASSSPYHGEEAEVRLELDGGAEQPAGTEDWLRRWLRRPDGQGERKMAVPLPQDRSLRRRVTPKISSRRRPGPTDPLTETVEPWIPACAGMTKASLEEEVPP